MNCISAAFLTTMIVLIAVTAPLEGGPKINAGKWEFKTTVTTPMSPQPKEMTNTRCITDEEASRDPLAAMLEESECKILTREESGDTIEFELECTGEMDMTMRGKGKFTADGSTATGNMEMTMTIPQMGGKTMKMSQEWEAKRIGDCD